MMRFDDENPDWPARPWIMALVGAASGLLIYFLQDGTYPDGFPVWRQIAISFLVVASLSFVLTIERRRWWWSLAFALCWGAVIAFVGWFTASYNRSRDLFEFPFLSGLLAVAIAAPLFQAARDEGKRRFAFARVHRHVWTDAVIGGSALLFTGIAFLLAYLISELFHVIGVDLIQRLMRKDWFTMMLFGTAAGGAIGVLRERDALAAGLQKLVTVVLAVLAPVLAAALVIFLLSVPFQGMSGLWRSGIPATPLLLTAAAGAFVLANDVFGDGSDEEQQRNPVLRWSALALVLCILPFAVLATLSMSQRIGQYGWTPERIWGVIACAAAIVFGLIGWWSIYKGRAAYADRLRPLQVRFAIGLCGVAVLLAMPILDFGAISTNSQLARLNSGKLAPAEFDWKALAFDFGPKGREALERINRAGSPDQRKFAATALSATTRWELSQDTLVAGPVPKELTVYPAGAVVPEALKIVLVGKPGSNRYDAFCSSGGACRVYAQDGGQSFIVINDSCANLPPAQRDDPKTTCTRDPGTFELREGQWTNAMSSVKPEPKMTPAEEVASLRQESQALDQGQVRIVTVTRRQIEIGGKKKGLAFE